MTNSTVTITLRLPAAVIRAVDEKAREQHRSRNRQIARWLEHALTAEGVQIDTAPGPA